MATNPTMGYGPSLQDQGIGPMDEDEVRTEEWWDSLSETEKFGEYMKLDRRLAAAEERGRQEERERLQFPDEALLERIVELMAAHEWTGLTQDDARLWVGTVVEALGDTPSPSIREQALREALQEALEIYGPHIEDQEREIAWRDKARTLLEGQDDG